MTFARILANITGLIV